MIAWTMESRELSLLATSAASSLRSSILGEDTAAASFPRVSRIGESAMPIARKSLANLKKSKAKIDWTRVRATSEPDITRQAAEDGHPVLTTRQLKRMRVVEAPASVDIRSIRRRQRLSQSAFARKYGFSARTIQEWEQGRAQPDRPARLLLAMIDRAPKTVDRILHRL